jgi:hypothetical protein
MAHLNSPTHAACYQNHLARAQAREEQLEGLAGAYRAEGIADYPKLPLIEPSVAPLMFSEHESDVQMQHSPRATVSQLIEELGQGGRQEVLSAEETRALFCQEYEQMLEDASHEISIEEDMAGDRFVGDEMLIDALGEEDEADCFDFSLLRSSEYHPYPSKTVSIPINLERNL